MFEHLDIYDRRERRLVGLADVALAAVAWPLRWRTLRARPRRILLLRLERIGDLLMTLGAIRSVRRLAPDASIDLVVGSWNRAVAETIAEVDRVEVLDAPWLARGERGSGRATLASRALAWRRQGYDLAINFEGDIRSHLLMAASLAPRRVGFDMAGGGPLLTERVRHAAAMHTAENALTLVERAFELPAGTLPGPLTPEGASDWRLTVPPDARRAAAGLLAGVQPPLVAVHAPGGRAVKQWPVERFAEVARALAREHKASLLLTGAPGDEPVTAALHRALTGGSVTNIAGHVDLLTLAAALERCALIVTGDTGPMHLAAAVGTPVVAVFGPSDPARYGPLIDRRHIVRIDLPCAPCNRIRLPPERCTGVTPDCLAGVAVSQVMMAARHILDAAGVEPRTT